MRLTAIVATVLAMVLSLPAAAAERVKVSRAELVGIAAQADIASKDYEAYTLTDGRPAVRVQQPQRGVMLAIIGPAHDVSDVIAIMTASEETFLQREFMLAQLAAKAARWDGGAEWVIKSVAETAKNNGGERRASINGHTIVVGTMPPAIMRLSVSRD